VENDKLAERFRIIEIRSLLEVQLRVCLTLFAFESGNVYAAYHILVLHRGSFVQQTQLLFIGGSSMKKSYSIVLFGIVLWSLPEHDLSGG
jgi:hypothetical protein